MTPLARISHTLSLNLDNLSRHLRPQIPSPCRFDNVLRYLRTNLTQHLAQLHSRSCEKCGLGQGQGILLTYVKIYQISLIQPLF